jgi:Raf kinase inhibitor-like YbhB/YbcL family protein
MEILSKQIQVSPRVQTFNVTSEAFKHKGFIPAKYTFDGENINPPLSIGDFPKETKSLVLIVDDPDAPIRSWTHWTVWNITPTHFIKEATAPGKEGVNDMRYKKYSGPCPVSGIHRYFFKVYALNKSILNLPPATTGKYELERAMDQYIIGRGELIGLYLRA